MLRPNDPLPRLKAYSPPLDGRMGLRLDFNENTAGCSPLVLARLQALTASDLTRYPERQPAEKTVADFLDLRPSQVLLTNGVDEAIHLLCAAYLQPGHEALIVVPTFAMYELCAAATGATVAAVQAKQDFSFPAANLVQTITQRTRLIALANPNNPTGAAAASEQILAVAQAAPQAALLVDEAYFEFYGHSLIAETRRVPNLFIARTFSKAYGLAGLRIGVLAGPEEQMQFLRRLASPYNVNAVALACLPAALEDQQYVRDYVAQVQASRTRLQNELRSREIPYWPSQANFVLAQFGENREALVQGMRRRGILVRDRNSDPGCAGCVRITVGTLEQTDLLLAALRECLAEIAPERGVPA